MVLVSFCILKYGEVPLILQVHKSQIPRSTTFFCCLTAIPDLPYMPCIRFGWWVLSSVLHAFEVFYTILQVQSSLWLLSDKKCVHLISILLGDSPHWSQSTQITVVLICHLLAPTSNGRDMEEDTFPAVWHTVRVPCVEHWSPDSLWEGTLWICRW